MQRLDTLPLLASLLAAAANASPSLAAAQDVPFAPITPGGGSHVGSDLAPDGATAPPVMPPTYALDAVVEHAGPERPSAPRLSSLEGRNDRLHHDAGDGAHWVRARSYKASASADGFTYVPFLGSTASRNYPVSMSVAAVTVGGEPLPFARTAAVQREGDAFLLDRGPVDARYDLALDTVEQSFVVETGAMVGDLVVTLDVLTDLDGTASGAGFRFAGPEGGVDYGAAVALDGSGNELRIPATLEGGALRLTVPAHFVAAAGGEVVIDPILSTYELDVRPRELTDVDVAYDATSDEFVYVFEDRWSATDMDVYLVAVDAATGAQQHELYVDSSTADHNDPEVAGLNGEDVMLIVMTHRFTTPEVAIRGRLYDVAGGFTLGTTFTIGDTGAGDWTNARPDVGGNSSSAPGQRFLVTWERTFDLTGSTLPRFTTVDSAGNVGALGTVLGSGGAGVECTWVRCSESTGRPSTVNVWNVCFAERDTVTGEEELRVAQINADGTIASPVGVAVGAGAGAVFETLDVSDAIEVSGFDPTYLVVYDDFSQTDEDVTAVVCRNSSSVRRVDVTRSEHGDGSANQNFAKVATTRDEFIVTYSEYDGSAWQTVLTALDLVEGNRLAISERRVVLGEADPGSGFDGSPGVASRFSGGLYTSRYVGIGWEVNGGQGASHRVEGVTYFAGNPASPAWQYCDGTVNSTGERGFLRLEGFRNTITAKTARASSLPPGQFALLVCGDFFANTPLAGGGLGTLCVGGNLGRYNGQIQQADPTGDVSFTINPQALPSGIGTVAAAPGDRYNFQVWHRDFVGLPTSNFTNAASIRFE